MRHVLLTLVACCLYITGYSQNPACAGLNSAFSTSISGGTVTFTNNSTLPSTPNAFSVNYYWNFGDGGSVYTPSSAPITHTYPVAGTYTVSFDVHWYDSVANVFCHDSVWTNITVTAGALNCALNQAGFTSSVSASTATFTNTSTGTPPTGYTVSYFWLFGDGGFSSAVSPSKTYAIGGTYTVQLVRRWILGNNFYCADTAVGTVTVAGFNCANNIASFTHTTNALTASFTNTSTPAMSGMYRTYNWNFGDGGSISTALHPLRYYATAGTYNARLITQWRNSSNNAIVCVDTTYDSVTVSMNVNCNNLSANFNANPSQFTNYAVIFNSQSTFQQGTTRSYLWDFGDGTTGTASSSSHLYPGPGTYNVTLVTTWSGGGQVLCIDSASQQVTLNTLPNRISGYVQTDSASFDSTSIFKVYLIDFDSATNWLSAVDSTYTVSGFNSFYYEFNNKPSGQYRVKAQHFNGPSSGTGYVPTYHYSSLYWNTANTFYHAGVNTVYRDIDMLTGTVTSGPGFVGGNVSQGANKGTGAGIEGMTVLLLDNATMEPVASAMTDVNGNFSFSSLPEGTYLLHPEQMNYNTVPTTITITAAQPYVTNINFERSNSNREIKLVPTGIGNVNKVNDAFVMFPNPATGAVTLQWNTNAQAQRLLVTDVTGKKVYEQQLNNAGGKATLQLGSLQSGIYIVTFETANGQGIQKLVIQH